MVKHGAGQMILRGEHEITRDRWGAPYGWLLDLRQGCDFLFAGDRKLARWRARRTNDTDHWGHRRREQRLVGECVGTERLGEGRLSAQLVPKVGPAGSLVLALARWIVLAQNK